MQIAPWIWCTVILLLCILGFMTLGVSWNAASFIMAYRAQKLLTLLIVGYSVGISTLLFQTLTQNNILTPSLLGFDALYVLIQSCLVFFLGAFAFGALNVQIKFGVQVLILIGAAMALYHFLLKDGRDLIRLVLVGIVFGVLFRSLSSLVARLIDPDEYFIIQSAGYARFGISDGVLLAISAAICVLSAFFIWRTRFVLDVLMLGRSVAMNLGVDYPKAARFILFWVSVLVACATALVGPIVFFGLLTCALTNQITRKMAHNERLILAPLIASIILVAGQLIFEQLFSMQGVLAVIIELFGGILFLWLVFVNKGRV